MGILQEILKTLSLPEFYFAMFRSATPVLLTTLGAMISSRSGTSNIALEGTMLISAFVGVVVSAFSQSAWIGFFGAVLAGFIVSNILAYFILKLNSNAVISGIALNTFASGGTIFVLYLITGEKGASTSLSSLKLPSVTIPVVKDIPVIGAVLSGHHVLTYAALILPGIGVAAVGFAMVAAGVLTASTLYVGQYREAGLCGAVCLGTGAVFKLIFNRYISRLTVNQEP